MVLRHGLEELQGGLEQDDSELREFLSILSALQHLPPVTDRSVTSVTKRKRAKRDAGDRLLKLHDASSRIGQYIEDCLKVFNGEPGRSESYDALHELLERLPYRLAYWKTAFQEINYRRFFDINELAGLRMEDPEVFAATHGLVLRLVRERKVTGLRLDHPDGLYDPGGYVEALQEAIFLGWASEFAGADATEQAFRKWRQSCCEDGVRRPLYIIAEKILEGREALPEGWPLHGTSGYDFLNSLTPLFVDSAGLKMLRQIYTRVTGRQVRFADLAYQCKKLITSTALSSEPNVLTHALNRIAEADRLTRDFTLESLREALREVVACFPVYRTYVSRRGVSAEDRRTIDLAVARAKRRNAATEPSIFDFVRDVLLAGPEGDPRWLAFAMKFQQYTGPVQAKGVEDTAFYRYNMLLSLNEVGGDPQHFGGPPRLFHEANQRRREQWPFAMLDTATHDHKRGEDARARLNVLSEIPDKWGEQVTDWMEMNVRNRSEVEGELAPDLNDEYLFYQALLGAWPAEPQGTVHAAAPAELVQRLRAYMAKAIKEAKIYTSWIHPAEDYDQAVDHFVQQTLAGPGAGRFLAAFLPFQQEVASLGMLNSLAQVVLKIVSPGVRTSTKESFVNKLPF